MNGSQFAATAFSGDVAAGELGFGGIAVAPWAAVHRLWRPKARYSRPLRTTADRRGVHRAVRCVPLRFRASTAQGCGVPHVSVDDESARSAWGQQVARATLTRLRRARGAAGAVARARRTSNATTRARDECARAQAMDRRRSARKGLSPRKWLAADIGIVSTSCHQLGTDACFVSYV